MSQILIIDDDVASCRTLEMHFNSQGYEVYTAHSVKQGLDFDATVNPDIIILDIRMPGESGMDGLPLFKQQYQNARVLMITAFHDMDTTIQAMKLGADDYIHKPIDIDELDQAINKALMQNTKYSDDLEIFPQDFSLSTTNTMVGHSKAMREIYKTIGMVANSPATVLITGESGTGKELVARAIHKAGKNPDAPFVAINCAALVETLLESDMFGHEKGAFTGAVTKQIGKFTMANNGTIFLDEIGELSASMQAKLLRVLQEKEYLPLGAKELLKTNARVIAATNVDLTKAVEENTFREDLYYRLQVVNIHVPPLRERREDIPDLVQALLSKINKEMNSNIHRLSLDVITYIQNYDWPGNVRELENTLMKTVALCSGEVITGDLLPNKVKKYCEDTTTFISSDKSQEVSKMSLQEIEKQHIIRVLEAANWHKGKVCEILGVSRPRLRRLISQYNLDRGHDENSSIND
ncbi:MAG: sigma-54 dependent transcriptional regulator [Gammaproteobacteria bacterium]